MGTTIIDSNSIIEFVGKRLPALATSQISAWIEAGVIATSIINKIEVMSYNALTPETEIDFEAFFDSITVLSLSDDIAIETYLLRRQVKMKLPDAVIAATALYYDLTLVTRNTHDFKNIPGLTVVNPHEF